ncbi:PadR family transcriptional regulator [Oceanobacillus jeddahense]|uniref:PadR family transcriptional regulator n=1 Tax=Oceanobacillus jeddahense TaxID=1462527 RepID=UPI0005960607|nr:PadR family transcriptional regulator [Oceanobacillus jeddahense]
MSLRFGILGLLSKWEASGYDIKKEFDDVLSVVWHSHLSQIYPELNKLEKEGMIKSKVIPQAGKPDKKVYAITDNGVEALQNWLLTPPEPPKIKDTFLMQTFFMDNIPADEVLLQLRIYKKEREQRLSRMKKNVLERLKSIQERNVMKSRILMAFAVLRRGLEQEKQYIKWCEDTIKFVESCKYLWDKQEEEEIDPASNVLQNDNSEIASFKEVEDIFLDYFAGLIEEE